MKKYFANKTFSQKFWPLFWPSLSGLLAALLLILVLKPSLNHLGETETKSPLHNSGLTTSLTPHSFSSAVELSAPAVVNIYTRKTVIRHSHPLLNDPFARNFFGLSNTPRESIQSGLGSGVIMNAEGYILTNKHVIHGADEILVELRDKRQSRAQVIGSDSETDLAVLKISLEKIPYIKNISSDIAVGDIALAIGNPLGIGQTVTMGIISATGRSNLGLNTYENFIQTDAAINRGNSGGALIDSQGNLIGINSIIFSKSGGSDGIGLAIPAPLAEEVLQSIIQNGRVIRGWLGADFQKLSPELANYLKTQENNGVVIISILKNSPAEKAGIMVGDLILSIDGEVIINEQDALIAIASVKPNELSSLRIIRQGQEITLNVKVGERPTQ